MNDEHGVDYGACGAGSTVVYRTLQHGQAARFGQGKLWAKSGLWIRFTSHCTSRYRHYSGRSGGNGKNESNRRNRRNRRKQERQQQQQQQQKWQSTPKYQHGTVLSLKGIKYIHI